LYIVIYIYKFSNSGRSVITEGNPEKPGCGRSTLEYGVSFTSLKLNTTVYSLGNEIIKY